jgi:hypothetical protein
MRGFAIAHRRRGTAQAPACPGLAGSLLLDAYPAGVIHPAAALTVRLPSVTLTVQA